MDVRFKKMNFLKFVICKKMKNSALFQNLFVVLLTVAPFCYAAMIWSQLPETVPTHFDINGNPNGFSSKNTALLPIFFMMALGLGVYFLINNIEKIDPKRANQLSKDTFNKIALLVVIFMSGLSIYIVHSMLQSTTGSFLFVLMGLFFAALGNLMHSIQPNYFVGFRLPWTLSNDENWRKTHQLVGKLWFGGGLLIAFAALLLKSQQAIFFMIAVLIMVCIIPIVYSFRLFKNKGL